MVKNRVFVLDEVLLIGGHALVLADHLDGAGHLARGHHRVPAQGSRAKLSSTQFVDTGTPLSPTAVVQDLAFVTGAVSGDRELPCCRERCARNRTGPARAGSVLTYGRPKCDLAAETANRSTITQIYEGTNQIQRMVMARRVLA